MKKNGKDNESVNNRNNKADDDTEVDKKIFYF